MRNQKGFTLLETIVGLAVVAVIGVGILLSLATTTRSNITNSNLTKAESLARAQMEYVQSQPYTTGSYQVITAPTGYTFTTPMISSMGTDLQRVTVTVNYYSKTLFTIEDYKVNR
jgi:prepilin-type N-terminal cleavage/methylation domain-containing protein